MKWWDRMPWPSFSECWALSHFFTLLFHFHQEAFEFVFTFCHKGGVICISEVIDIFPGNLDSSLCFFQKTANLIHITCALTAPLTSHTPILLPPGASYFLRYNNIATRLIRNPTMTSKCSSDRKSHMSLTLNQKLEMIIKLNEKGMSKAEIGQNPYPFSQIVS